VLLTDRLAACFEYRQRRFYLDLFPSLDSTGSTPFKAFGYRIIRGRAKVTQPSTPLIAGEP
jgi:hypothetical protein